MPSQESEEEDAALPEPCFSTPTKANHNDGAGHAEQDAKGMQTKSDANVEKRFDESTGKKRKYHPFFEYREVKLWFTGEDSVLEPVEIKPEMYMLMKNFMQDIRLMQAPGHREQKADIGLWKKNSNTPNISTRELMK